MQRELIESAVMFGMLGLATPQLAAAQAARTGAPPSQTAAGETGAHHLVIAAGACWLGGVWSDAEGASEIERSDASRKRCQALIESTYGRADEGRFERFRAVDAVELSDYANKVAAAASTDHLDAAQLAELRGALSALAEAERETVAMRRAADKVKDAIAVPKPTPQRKHDETMAADALSESKQLDALLGADLGGSTHELRAFGLLLAMDRLQVARGLPKHLKVLAARGPIKTVFGVAAPALPEDPTQPPAGGVWLTYLTSVANAAQHPVPDQAKSLRDKELLAWGGVLMGFADKLHSEAPHIALQTELRRVVDAVSRRLETEYRADQAAMLKAANAQAALSTAK